MQQVLHPTTEHNMAEHENTRKQKITNIIGLAIS